MGHWWAIGVPPASLVLLAHAGMLLALSQRCLSRLGGCLSGVSTHLALGDVPFTTSNLELPVVELACCMTMILTIACTEGSVSCVVGLDVTFSPISWQLTERTTITSPRMDASGIALALSGPRIGTFVMGTTVSHLPDSTSRTCMLDWNPRCRRFYASEKRPLIAQLEK